MKNWHRNRAPILALAPMADMTDSAFCRIARQASGTDFIAFREMTNSEAIVRGSERTLDICRFEPIERPIVQQLFGADPEVMAEAARIIDERLNPDGFDVNMGCPARKIVSNFNGSALMKEPARAEAIVKKMKAATIKPLSVKTRLGWSKKDEILDFAKRLEDAGADLITVHGRTKEQGYAGQADWEMIGRVKGTVRIPVLLNGDVTDGPAAAAALKTSGCDGIMVGRSALGNPWIFAEIKSFLEGTTFLEPTLEQRLSTALEHAKLHAEIHPGELPLVSLRAHLIHYLKGMPRAKEWRLAVIGVSTLKDLEAAANAMLR